MLRWQLYLAVIIGICFIRYKVKGTECSLSHNISNRIKVLPQAFINAQEPSTSSSLAYAQYATNAEYLQLAVTNLALLRRSGTTADLVLLYSRNIPAGELNKLSSIIEYLEIKLKPVDLLSYLSGIWQHSFTKLHVFGLPYDRVIYFDADGMLINFEEFTNKPVNMDELFDIPQDIDLAMPQAYWLSTQKLQKKVSGDYNQLTPQSLVCDSHKYDNRLSFFGSHIMVVKPSQNFYQDIMKYVNNPWYWNVIARNLILQSNDYDMEVINRFVDDNLRSGNRTFGVLDHRVYGVLTGEFRQENHERFLRDPQFVPFDVNTRQWDALSVIRDTKYIHFSDEPIPKPWMPHDNLAHYNTFKIRCKGDSSVDVEFPVNKPRETEDCDSVLVWNWIMKTFSNTFNLTDI